jgi:hypothetical protein
MKLIINCRIGKALVKVARTVSMAAILSTQKRFLSPCHISNVLKLYSNSYLQVIMGYTPLDYLLNRLNVLIFTPISLRNILILSYLCVLNSNVRFPDQYFIMISSLSLTSYMPSSFMWSSMEHGAASSPEANIVKKVNKFPPFIETECSSPCSQEPPSIPILS